jgi:uncharacterized protein (TIGR03086 family)
MVRITHRRATGAWGTLPMRHRVGSSQDRAVEPGPTTDAITQLIQRGRDREAAALGSERLATTTGGTSMDPINQLDQVMPMLKDIVATLTPEELAAQTPCDKFAVQDVLEHMIAGGSMFAAAFRGEAPPAAPPSGDPLVLFPKVMDELVASMKAPGALDQMVDAPFGTVPGEVFARFVALDGLVHGWDVSTATGKAYAPPADLVGAADAFAHQALAPEMRDGETFKAETEVSAGASPIERLAAFTGRTVPAVA